MLVINYKGITPQNRFYSLGVRGDSKSNVISFIVQSEQEDIILSELSAYLKVQNKEHDYIDKIDLGAFSVDDNGLITLNWEMTRKSTQYRNLELQLVFEDSDNEIVWQTQIVELELSNTISADKEISEQYPTILEQLEKLIKDIEAHAEIIIMMVYFEDELTIQTYNAKGELHTHKVNIPTSDKVVKTNSASKVYGTDENGNQTTYDKDDFGKVDDVKVNGTSVVSDKVANVDLTPYEEKANKTTSISQNSTDTQYPSAKAVYDFIQAYKRNAFQEVNTTTYPTLADFLASEGEEGYIYLYPIDTSDLTKGYKQYIWEESHSDWVYLGDTQLDLTNYPRKDQEETITRTWTWGSNTGIKFGNSYGAGYTFKNRGDGYLQILNNNNSPIYDFDNLGFINRENKDLGSSTYKWKDLYLSGNININKSSIKCNDIYFTLNLNGSDKYYFYANSISPSGNGQDLGTNALKWRNLYLSGNISDGTNSVKVAEIGKKLLSIESQRHLTSGEAKQCVGGIQVQSDYYLNLGGGVLLKNPYITGIQTASTIIDITAVGLNTTQQMVMYSGRLTINASDDTIAVSESNITTRVLSELATTDYFGFKVIPTPSSTTLTDDEIVKIASGCIIKNWLGKDIIVFFPCMTTSTYNTGLAISSKQSGQGNLQALCIYEINGTTKTISLNDLLQSTSSNYWDFVMNGANALSLSKLKGINGVDVPQYPNSPTIPQQLIYDTDNTLKWINSLDLDVIEPPSSTSLTADQIAHFQKGCIVKGTFLNRKNGIYFPLNYTQGQYSVGFFVSTSISGGDLVIGRYLINPSDVIYTDNDASINFNGNTVNVSGKNVSINGSVSTTIKGKTLPSNPANTGKFAFQCVDGTLVWEETIKEDFSSQISLDNESSLTILRKECYLIKQGDEVKMHIYISGKNESGASVNGVRFSGNSTFAISSSDIANAIKDMNGNAVSSATAGQIKSIIQQWYNDGNTTVQSLRLHHNTTNGLYLYSAGYSASIPDNANFIVSIDEVLAI